MADVLLMPLTRERGTVFQVSIDTKVEHLRPLFNPGQMNVVSVSFSHFQLLNQWTKFLEIPGAQSDVCLFMATNPMQVALVRFLVQMFLH